MRSNTPDNCKCTLCCSGSCPGIEICTWHDTLGTTCSTNALAHCGNCKCVCVCGLFRHWKRLEAAGSKEHCPTCQLCTWHETFLINVSICKCTRCSRIPGIDTRGNCNAAVTFGAFLRAPQPDMLVPCVDLRPPPVKVGSCCKPKICAGCQACRPCLRSAQAEMGTHPQPQAQPQRFPWDTHMPAGARRKARLLLLLLLACYELKMSL